MLYYPFHVPNNFVTYKYTKRRNVHATVTYQKMKQ
uniref:Uncharacterized protein n=1 Tax=Arundo donax TaxID=35708 RepID=A0A0A8YSS5_ARUDO